MALLRSVPLSGREAALRGLRRFQAGQASGLRVWRHAKDSARRVIVPLCRVPDQGGLPDSETQRSAFAAKVPSRLKAHHHVRRQEPQHAIKMKQSSRVTELDLDAELSSSPAASLSPCDDHLATSADLEEAVDGLMAMSSRVDSDLSCYKGLVLDVSYTPIDVICWKRSLCMDFLQKADVLEYYDIYVHSAYAAFPLPAVLKVNTFVQVRKAPLKVVVTKQNILIRDKHRCQYCGDRENLTIDHVLAASRGGSWNWNNLVAACDRCNRIKGDKTLEQCGMVLRSQPKEPNAADFHRVPFRFNPGNAPVEWLEYLPKRFFSPFYERDR